MLRLFLLMSLCVGFAAMQEAHGKSWTADNGNGTFTNPVLYDEFSDPDIIRVGDDFYLVGTTMHTMPAVVVLHSKDLVNWSFLSYAAERLDLGPEFDLVDGLEAYGQGIWAPCIRFHEGRFYIFTNVNDHGLQVFTAEDPAGPWEHRSLSSAIHDLSVLFDDDGRVYAVYHYDEVRVIEMKPDLSGFIQGSDRVIIPAGNAMGEGHHIYKIDGKYFILSANYSPTGRMQCARADSIDGPWETVVISTGETLGTQRGVMTQDLWMQDGLPEPGAEIPLAYTSDKYMAVVPMHQGGVVDLPNGDWWGFSMLDFNAVGRTFALSPVTWKDGWPYFGLEGNLGRSPRTWQKPAVDVVVEPHAPYERSDDFSDTELKPIWQWNHNPVEGRWSLSEHPGALRLHTLPARQFLWARNTLTQRGIGPVSVVTVELDASGLRNGDEAGLGLLNIPFASLGVRVNEHKYQLEWYDQGSDESRTLDLEDAHIYLRVRGDYDRNFAQMSYSLDGDRFIEIGGAMELPYQLKTFQGTRIALYAFNRGGETGGFADFLNFKVDEPLADRSANLPLGKWVSFSNLANRSILWANPHGMLHSVSMDAPSERIRQTRFLVHDRGEGKVVLEAADGAGFLTVVGEGLPADVRLMPKESEDSLFMWQDMVRDRQCMLLSLKTHRYIGQDVQSGEPFSADWVHARPDRKGGAVFDWREVSQP